MSRPWKRRSWPTIARRAPRPPTGRRRPQTRMRAMLRNVFLKTLRDNRVAILVWGLGLGLLLLVGVTQYPLFINGDEGQRARQAAGMAKLFQAYSFLLGEVVPLDTLGGFITVRILGQIPVMLSLW